MFMINDMSDNFIPSDQQPKFLADGSYYLALAILELAKAEGIPSEGKQKAGVEAIELARQALKIHTQLHGSGHAQIAGDMTVLADVLDYFNNVDDDEVLRLRKQSISLQRQLKGSLSYNTAIGNESLGRSYCGIASRATEGKDWDRGIANLNLALTHCREAVRIYKAINLVDKANDALRNITVIYENIRKIGIAKAAMSSASAAATKG